MSSKIETLHCEETSLGLLCLRRREPADRPGLVVTEVSLNYEFLMSSHVTASERALARQALALHAGRGLDVLVGGLGLGYTAREALASERVRRVEVVELLSPVIDWLEQGLIPLADELQRDARLVVTAADVYRRLLGPAERQHDLILIDVDHTPELPLASANASFYTEAGLERARSHLAPGGVLAVWSYADSTPFAAALRRVFADVRVEPIVVFNDLNGVETTDWLFLARDPVAGASTAT
ncbi:MAG: spermidine synthase [Polyangiaceae bacterium]|nr:spermidine synthase [Polyangiaceae bacterium]